MQKFLLLFNFLIFVLVGQIVSAYPDFIGYGYSSCITCHYNGQGGGALNDYGRALYATEITARDVYSEKTDEEEIGDKSKFLVTTDLPWWVRPGLKYRGLWFQASPGATESGIQKFINMQYDINLNFFLDQKQKLALITTTSYSTYPLHFATSTNIQTKPFWYEKEYYLRYQISKNYWLYLGQLDKVFGIRQVDHTMVSRMDIGFGYDDQSQGAVLNVAYPTWDISVNAFAGNQLERSDVKQKGISISGEYEIADKNKLGASIYKSKSDIVEWTRAALHSRIGIGKGKSLLTEVGVFKNTLVDNPGSPPLGAYLTVQSLVLIRRGYNLLTTIQYVKKDTSQADAERTSFGFGALIFPLPRLELRLAAINGKTYDQNSGISDSWQLQTQAHVSW